MKNIHIDPTDKSVKILIVEDDDDAREMEARFLSHKFPNAQIDKIVDFLNTDIEEMIAEMQYTLIMLDKDLSQWEEHPKFGTSGIRIIPTIKEKSPATIIVAISGDKNSNEKMVKAGADFPMDKDYFIKRGGKLPPELSFLS